MTNFPRIENFSDILPAIQDRKEFVLKDDEENGFRIVNYGIPEKDTFYHDDPVIQSLRRECRGIMFDRENGRILRRPFQKYFNLQEKPETQLNNIDISRKHIVMNKLDGSLVMPHKCPSNGAIRWGTKMGITDVAMQAEEFVSKNNKYNEFVEYCINNDLTPCFEWCSRKQRIVLDYPKDRLVLLAVRHMITGEYIKYQ